ncbi:MAG: NlpC/P60 family protein [Pseudomonadota bacterium]
MRKSEPAFAAGWRSPITVITLALLVFTALVLGNGCASTPARYDPVLSRSGHIPDSSIGPLGNRLAYIPEPIPGHRLSLTQKILATAYSQYGKAYRFGGVSPETGFDCSGLAQWTFGQHGVKLPRTPGDLLKYGAPVNRGEIRPGDLLIYSDRWLHVGIYAGKGIFIHSPRTGYNITEDQAFSAYHSPRLIGIRRVIDDPDAAPLPPDLKEKIIKSALAASRDPGRAKAAAAANQPPSQISGYYRVKPGDTIWNLARSFGVSPQTLLQLNNLNRHHTLQVGQKLVIPPASGR